MENKISENKSLEAIIAVIAFFDLFDFPLTALEIWEDTSHQVFLGEIINLLKQTDKIEEKNGFYFLKGRVEIIGLRRARYFFSERKMRIARRFAYLFSLCPFVQVVALANSLGFYNLRRGSDLDFFIITSPGKVWLSRLYCAGLAKILACRPTDKVKQDKICLSFYVSADHLNLDDLRLAGGDPYFDYWRRHLLLLYNKNGIYEKFLAANNLITAAENFLIPPGVIGLTEKIAQKLQLWLLPTNLRILVNQSDGVVINYQVIKLYRRDRRRYFLDQYGNKISKIFKENF